jgi:hypothetical protein
MNEKEYDFSIDNKCQVEWYNEDGSIQYIVNFTWNFGRWNYEGDLDIEVYFHDSFKEMGGIRSYFEPKESQVKEMIEFIQEKILEDPNDFGFEGFVEDERDFQTDNNEY